MRKTQKTKRTYLQIKLSLEDSPLPIWRRLLMVPDMSLDVVHECFQIAMGWWDYHLYDFQLNGRHFGDLEDADGDPKVEDSSQFLLSDFLKKPGDNGKYLYDFGDSWYHEFTLEKIISLGEFEEAHMAKCLHGKRANPPEDCGGISGFTNLVEAYEDPLHADRKDILGWLESDYNPDAFDTRLVNLRLRLLEQEIIDEAEAMKYFDDLQKAKKTTSQKKGKQVLSIVSTKDQDGNNS